MANHQDNLFYLNKKFTTLNMALTWPFPKVKANRLNFTITCDLYSAMWMQQQQQLQFIWKATEWC